MKANRRRDAEVPIGSALPPGGTETIYRYMIDGVTEYAIFTISPQGVVETWNPGAERSFGYAADEIIGKKFDVFFTAADLARDAPACEIDAAVADGRVDVNRWHMRKDGSSFFGVNTMQPARDGAGEITAFTKIVRDTTKEHDAAEALRQSEERLRLLVESVKDYAIFAISPERLITLWNTGGEHVFGYATEDIVGKPYDRLFSAADVANSVPQRNLATALARGTLSDDRWLTRKNGSQFLATSKLTTIADDSKAMSRGFVCVAHDVTLQKYEAAELRYEAHHDSLTGLPNRSLFLEHLRRTKARSRRSPLIYFAVLFLDLDRFKLINDSLGHAFADRALVCIGERIASSLRAEDIVARIGGDEFAILVGDLRAPGEAVTFAERLHTTLATPFRIEGHEIFVTASVGIVVAGATSDEPEQLLRDADTAMYAAKSRGRAKHVVFDTKMHETVVALHTLETDLRYAVKRDELCIAYQPVVALADGYIVGFEALVRWNHPTRGLLLPDQFMNAAEDTGLIIGIDRWVIREACREIGAWNARNPTKRPLDLSVNFSSRQFVLQDLVGYVEAVLAQTGLPPERLKIEITESVLIERTASIDGILTGLRASGIEIHIDDFGTGYSSLSYLRRLPVNVLKIDRSFVSTMVEDVESFEIVRSIVSLSTNLRLQSMAEGIETRQQLAALRDLRCAFGQGYLFSPAVPWTAAAALVEHPVPYASA